VQDLEQALGIKGAAGPGDRHDEFHGGQDTRVGRPEQGTVARKSTATAALPKFNSLH
jgi:hypothetical protein